MIVAFLTPLTVGMAVGLLVGEGVGSLVGLGVGSAVGLLVGAVVGDLVGLAVGSLVGLVVGCIVGLGVGTFACAIIRPIFKNELKMTLDIGLVWIASFEDKNMIDINMIRCFKKCKLRFKDIW